MEELKLKYLKGFLKRTELRVADILLKLEEWEDRIRSCYDGPISDNSNDFLKMIITDACFIIELFLRCYRFSEWKEKDPLFSKPWLLDDIMRDLILLENQLPFFVLENIYNLNLGMISFVTITCHYFQQFHLQNINPEGVRPKHLTDLVRTFMIWPSPFDPEKEDFTPKCLLDLKFDKGVLTMPCIVVHDMTETYLRNILAFEEYHLPYSAYVTQHFWFLDLLINTEKDVSILVDKKIIVNWMGDTNSVATMVHNLHKNISQPDFHSKYRSVCNSLNGFYERPYNQLYMGIFNTPVKMASTISATLLLLLTIIQTMFSFFSYLKE